MIKVDNAIILAAGRGKRLKHFTKDVPKPLLAPRGEIIIEGIIKNLHAKNIFEIFIVVGYLSEKFEYLKKKFGVKIIKNPLWETSNNITSLLAVKNKLKNSLIINGDIIMEKNVFQNEYQCSISYAEENQFIDEWLIDIDKSKNIKNFNKYGLDKQGFFQREILFITEEISKVIKTENEVIDRDEYYEFLILNISKKQKIPFKIFEIDKNEVYDLDTSEKYLSYSNNNKENLNENNEKINVKSIQAHLLKLLKKLILILEKNKINYHIAFGSVLGAVRHKGFIPWDDDIDICIIGEDYERFLKLMENEKNLTVVTKEKYPKYPLYFAKIMDLNFKYIEKSFSDNPEYPCGLFIDIFKLDFVDDSLLKKPFSLQLFEGLNFIKNSKCLKMREALIKLIAYFISQKTINKKVEKNIKKIIKNSPTNSLLDIYNDASSRIYKYEWFKTPKKALFCGLNVKIPSLTDPYLKSIYGATYMELPAIEKRISHCAHFKTLKK